MPVRVFGRSCEWADVPRKLAVEATQGNLKAIERIRTALAKKTATEMEAAQKQAELLNGVALKFTRKTGENDQMFGSVTSADIAEGLAAAGIVGFGGAELDGRQDRKWHEQNAEARRAWWGASPPGLDPGAAGA